jgi:hypothetical protein
MARITIEISLKDNELYYQDSESHSGFKIETHVKPEDEIVWFTKPDSGIEKLTRPIISGTAGFFEKEPSPASDTQWNARAGDISVGGMKYQFGYEPSSSIKNSALAQAGGAERVNEEDTPGLLMP